MAHANDYGFVQHSTALCIAIDKRDVRGFFEQAETMALDDTALYAVLCDFYQINPVNWLPANKA